MNDGAEQVRGKRGRPKGQATQVVYAALRGDILTLELRPGAYLEETVLEKRFGVSRTPIREALIRLQTDKLVAFSPNRGHYVENGGFDDIPKIFEALDLHQAAVLKLAARRRSETELSGLDAINDAYLAAGIRADHRSMTELHHDFHVLIGKTAGNIFLSEPYETMLNFSIRLSYLMFKAASSEPKDFRAYHERVHAEHAEMIRMMRDRDEDGLQDVSRKHVRLFSDRVVKFVTQRVEMDAMVQDFTA